MEQKYENYKLSDYQIHGSLLETIQELRFPEPNKFRTFPIFLEELAKVTAFNSKLSPKTAFKFEETKDSFSISMCDPSGEMVALVSYSPNIVNPYLNQSSFTKIKGLTELEFIEFKLLFAKIRWEDNFTQDQEFRYKMFMQYCSEQEVKECIDYENTVLKCIYSAEFQNYLNFKSQIERVQDAYATTN